MFDVMYVPAIARALGRTEAAVRIAFLRRSDSVPHKHAIRVGRRIAVLRSDFIAWRRKYGLGDLMYVPAIARALGRTEAAVRIAFLRRSDSVPHKHAIRVGRRIAVRRSDFRSWLKAKKKERCRA